MILKVERKMEKDFVEEYIKIYKAIKDKKINKRGPLTICPAIKGSEYKKGGLMFVGRAVNGWCPLPQENDERIIIERLKLCSKCTLNWIQERNDIWQICADNGCPYAKEKGIIDGRPIHSPFWYLVEYIYKKEYGEEPEWYKKIVWTNLYKLSYVNGGNPDGFYEPQIDACNRLLIKDIEDYKPRKIFFITENKGRNTSKQDRTWFCKSYPDGKLHFKSVYEYLEDKIDNNEIEVFVLTRPEFQKMDEVFKNMKYLNGTICNK